MTQQEARWWAEHITVRLLQINLTPKTFSELAGGERLRVLAHFAHEDAVHQIQQQQVR